MQPVSGPKTPKRIKVKEPEVDSLEGASLEVQFEMFLDKPASKIEQCSGTCQGCQKKPAP